MVFFLIVRLPPKITRTDTRFPYTTLCRSSYVAAALGGRGRAANLRELLVSKWSRRHQAHWVCRVSPWLSIMGFHVTPGALRGIRNHSLPTSRNRPQDRKSTRLNSSH